MPIQVKYLDNGLGLLFLGEGIVTGDDIIDSNNEIFSSREKMKNFKYGLIDYSNITQFNVSNSEIETITSQNKNASEIIPDGILAVAAKKDLDFGINRMWQIIIENAGIQWETMVFRDRANAEAWIKDRVRKKYNIEITMT